MPFDWGLINLHLKYFMIVKDLSLPFCHLRKRLLNGPGIYLLYCVFSGPGACHPALLCSYFPVSPEHAGSYQHFETEDKTQCVGQPPTHQKVGMLAVCFSLLFLSPGWSWKLGCFPPSCHTELGGGGGGGIMENECHEFSYQLWCVCFCTYLGCRSLFPGFWISYKGNWLMY